MRASDFNRSLSFCAALSLLAGCGGASQPLMTTPQDVTGLAARDEAGGSWMARDAAAQDLLYVSSDRDVSVYAYPNGKLVGSLKGFSAPHGMCIDATGNVYITDLNRGKVFEYGRGSTKRLKTLAAEGAVGCSIDPSTGNLAVTEIVAAAVAVFQNASGSPTVYTSPSLSEAYWCGYDDSGNLFIDGRHFTSPPSFVLLELAKGSRTLAPIALNQRLGFPGGVQWDGTHLAVGSDYSPEKHGSAIYEFSISGSSGTKVGTTPLRSGAYDVMQFWIGGNTVVVPNLKQNGEGGALFFHYPAGGEAYKKLVKDLEGGRGAAISLAPR